MRLWLKDSERRPDPAPVKTDDRMAVLVGTGLWAVALAVLLVVGGGSGGVGSFVVTCIVGIALGLAGLVYTSRRR